MNELTNNFNVPIIDPSLLNININVPKELQETFAANKHMLPKFARVMQTTIQKSFEHSDTRLRGDIRQEEVKLRVALCYEALRQMYFEEKMSLNHSLDILEGVVIDALRMGAAEPSSIVSPRSGNRWGVAAPDIQMEANFDEDLNKD